MEKEDVINKRFGKLTVITDGNGLKEGNKKLRSVICKCDCGNTKEVKLKYLRRGDIKSCGCIQESKILREVEKGEVFGFWTVIQEGEKRSSCKTVKVKCICGVEKEVFKSSILSGYSKSCGCKGIPPKEKIKKEKIIPTNTEEEQWKESVTFKGYYVSTLGRLFRYESQ